FLEIEPLRQSSHGIIRRVGTRGGILCEPRSAEYRDESKSRDEERIHSHEIPMIAVIGTIGACCSGRRKRLHENFVDVTPSPILSALKALDDGMSSRVGVL